MTCGDEMQCDVPRCVPHQRLLDALQLMGEAGTNWVAVVAAHEHSEFIGWITAREAALFLGVYDRRPSEVMCREVTSAPPTVLSAETDAESARRELAAVGERWLPVVQDGKLVGIFPPPSAAA